MPNGKSSRPTRGNTTPVQGETQQRSMRMPHERDESADSQSSREPSGQRIGAIAHDDLESGRVDTDKGPVMDATYERLRKSERGSKKPRR